MESSIAEFLERQLACELLPTVVSSNCKEFVGLGMKKARTHPKGGNLWHGLPRGRSSHVHSYLLGLLAMIKCSICSYQCDN